MGDRDATDAFHQLYYGHPERTIYDTHWLGVAAQKYPSDLWVYQEILAELHPDFIIETGTYWGGSALFLASICELLGHGHVITVDNVDMAVSDVTRPAHPRITYLHGSSIESAVVDQIREQVRGSATVMVILDSDHSREHVTNELKIYQEFVTEGSYLIVEDTNINGHPVLPDFGPGPMEAVELFLRSAPDFLPDLAREKFFVTANPGGFLRRVDGGGVQARLLRTELELAKERAGVDEAAQEAARQIEVERARAEDAEALVRARDALLADRKQQLLLVEEQLAAMEARLGQLEQTLQEATRQLAHEAEVRRAVEGSASWRLTRVLREAKRAVGGGSPRV